MKSLAISWNGKLCGKVPFKYTTQSTKINEIFPMLGGCFENLDILTKYN